MYGFNFSESGAGLSGYSAIIEGGRSTLNAVVNNFKKVIGIDPVVNGESGRTTYTWLLPVKVREDVILLQIVAEDDTVFIKYTFFTTAD